MLHGELVGLRARHESDVLILHADLHDDVATQSRSDSRAWQPISPDPAMSPFRVREPEPGIALFSVVQLATGELAGDAVLWSIDLHNRSAHIGVSLRPSFRGLGLGGDVVRVLCYYGFAVRGLHRLQIETLASNGAMIAAATRAGFTQEGRLRDSGWVNGQFEDEVLLGLLAADWHGSSPGQQ